MKFILMLLSVYRITYMIVFETGPLAIFDKLHDFIENKAYDKSEFPYDRLLWETKSDFWENVDEGINCPYCVSVWISAIVWMISRIKRVNKVFLDIFGLAGVYLLLQQVVDRIKSDDS